MRASCVKFFPLILHLFSVTSGKPHHDSVNDPLKGNTLKLLYYGDENGISDIGPSIEYEIPCGRSNVSDLVSERIVGGKTAKPYEFPWLVSIHELEDGKFVHNCVGSIIHSLFILTAAHCVDYKDINTLLILAGKFKLSTQEDHEQSRGVVEAFYSRFDPDTYENDIALLKLNESLKLEPYFVGPVCLPERNKEFKEKEVVAGWGRLQEKGNNSIELQKVTLNVISKNEGREIYVKKGYDNYLHKCQLYTLTDEKDACQGDSGGPLMSLNKENDKKVYITGIVSWGVGCARKGYPGVYAQVACYAKWIKKHIEDATQN